MSSQDLRVKQRERGITMLGFLAIMIVVGLVGAPILRAIPSILEYQSVKRAVQWAKQNSNNRKDAMAFFDKQVQIDRIEAITSKDLDISDETGSLVISFSYRKEVEFYGPVNLIITYSGEAR